jgi:hypothetical protein
MLIAVKNTSYYVLLVKRARFGPAVSYKTWHLRFVFGQVQKHKISCASRAKMVQNLVLETAKITTKLHICHGADVFLNTEQKGISGKEILRKETREILHFTPRSGGRKFY